MRKYVIPLILALLLVFIAGSGSIAQEKKIVIKSKDRKGQGYLGVYIEDVKRKVAKRYNLPNFDGAYVSEVVEDSPAEDAGIEEGDIIVKFGDKEIMDSDELREIIKETKPKMEVKVELYRKSEKKVLTVEVGKSRAIDFDMFSDYGDKSGHAFIYGLPKLPEMHAYPKKHITVISTEGELNGLKVQELTKQLGEYFGAPKGKGVLVSEVKKGSEAAKAGFKAGDVITKIDNETIDDTETMYDVVSECDEKEVAVEALRNGKTLTIKMKFEKENDDEVEYNILEE
jgi:serine protease Do